MGPSGPPPPVMHLSVKTKNKKPTSVESKPTSKGSVAIPEGFSEALKRTYDTYGVNAYFKATRTLN